MSGYSALKEFTKQVLPKAAVSAIGRYRARRRFHGYRPKQITRHFGDCDLTVELIDPLGERWYAHDWELPPEIPLLQQSRLKPGAIVFDLGAHQCVMAMLLARRVGPDGFVVAVEGGSANARAGARNIQLNSIANCRVIHAVAAAQSGRARFEALGNGRVIAGAAESAALLAEDVPAVSVDDLTESHGNPGVVYVDVEGSECDVLEGAKRTFLSRPDWLIEVHQDAGLESRGGSAAKVVSFFAGDYGCYVASETPSNNYTEWARFEPLEEAGIPSGRFFLAAIAKPA